MKRSLFALLLALLLLLPKAQADVSLEQPGVLRALLVSCDSFVSQPNTVSSSYNNLVSLRRALLGDRRGYDSIQVSVDRALDGPAFEALVQQAFKGAREGDTSLIYISTHGIREEGSEEFYALFSDGIKEYLVSGSQIHAALLQVPGTKLLIVDACFSGALINRAMDSPKVSSLFSSPDFLVLTSAGGMEPSYLWTDSRGRVQGGSFFAKALVDGISASGRFAADSNRDGLISLQELYTHLLFAHGASTPQVYPSQSQSVVLAYDVRGGQQPVADITGLSLESTVLRSQDEVLAFSYTLHSPQRLAYLLVYERAGTWRFDAPQSIPVPGGLIQPGRKEAKLALQAGVGGMSGYLLLMPVTIMEDAAWPQACVLLSVQTGEEEPALSLDMAAAFRPANGEEMSFILRHRGSIEYSAQILSKTGTRVGSLASLESSRPLHLAQEGTALYWNGKNDQGQVMPPGQYRLALSVRVGRASYFISSELFTLLGDGLTIQYPGAPEAPGQRGALRCPAW